MAKYLMFQGTSSHVGKSILTTALCRIFYRSGLRTVPFKAQNMALNSFVTADGREMGRAQVAQAEAAGLEPLVEMNPVLLKPTGNASSQVIIDGKPVGTMSAAAYHRSYSLKAFEAVVRALEKLDAAYDMIVLEGAGSPAEINLKDTDIVNMRVARHLGAPVILVADIDRGGSLAALVGTLELLDPAERDLVKGLVINKFRGDIRLFEPAVAFLEKKTGKPVLGVLPYIPDLGIDDEDSVSLGDKKAAPRGEGIKIAVVKTPKISNFTDFDSLAFEPDTDLYYVADATGITAADLIILPGSKNTSDDLLWLRRKGLEKAIFDASAKGIPIIGICGGYQMLGRTIYDPFHVETAHAAVDGMGLLPMETTLAVEKTTAQATVSCTGLRFAGGVLTAPLLSGYEIHMGRTDYGDGDTPLTVISRSGIPCSAPIGSGTADGSVWGTYLHGIFDNDIFRRELLNCLRRRQGLLPLTQVSNYKAAKEKKYDRLASIAAAHLDLEKIWRIVGDDKG